MVSHLRNWVTEKVFFIRYCLSKEELAAYHLHHKDYGCVTAIGLCVEPPNVLGTLQASVLTDRVPMASRQDALI
jgi:hypothetical protein